VKDLSPPGPTPLDTNFLAGVIEGFYGQPWSQVERFELFDWMAESKLNTYLYAPKDDLKHRALWREPYSASEAEALGQVIRLCEERSIRFIYALGPGLDICYHDEAELGHLRNRFEQILALGGQNFALLFDDIPERMNPNDLKRWGSFGSAQCHVVNSLFRWVRERRPEACFLFCPTPYCGRMAERELGGKDYLPTIGRELLPEIDVFWTGPEIISREITVDHVRETQRILRRKPLIWDNLYANDYDGRRFYCGPYSGRSPELRQEVKGLLVNPNNEFPLNYVALRTLGEFVHQLPSATWEPRQAYLSAMREWLPRFATLGQRVTLDNLVLFGDCYYLPYQQGPAAEALYQRARCLLAADPASWGNQAAALRDELARLRNFCLSMTELRERPLFYALSRRVWELREELDLLDRYLEFRSRPGQAGAPFTSDFHQPGTYRGGLVPQLQRLLEQLPDGTFAPASNS
jgi:protein O-GlcNAcase/histone acetyltransferase